MGWRMSMRTSATSPCNVALILIGSAMFRILCRSGQPQPPTVTLTSFASGVELAVRFDDRRTFDVCPILMRTEAYGSAPLEMSNVAASGKGFFSATIEMLWVFGILLVTATGTPRRFPRCRAQ